MAARQQRRLGEILLALGVIDDEQLRVLVAEQERTGRMLGELAVAMGLANSADVSSALADQKGWTADADQTSQSSAGESLEAPTLQLLRPPVSLEDQMLQAEPEATEQAQASATQATPPTQAEESDQPEITALPDQSSLAQTGAEGVSRSEPLADAQTRAQPATVTQETTPPPQTPQRNREEEHAHTAQPIRLELDRHLILLPTPTGYQLIERQGTAPAVGETIELSLTDGMTRYLVVRNTRAPLPAAHLRCARLEAM